VLEDRERHHAVETPHAWANLIESRVMMGTHGQPGYNPEREKMRFAEEVHRRVPASRRLVIQYRQLTSRKELWYYLDRSFDEITSLTELQRLPPRAQNAVLLVDEQLLDSVERPIFRALIAKHPVTFFDRFTMVDLGSDQPGEASWAFYDLPMSPLYRFFVSHKYPPLGLRRKAYLPGVCEALAAGAPIATDETPPDRPRNSSLDACWHNALVARGDRDRAEVAEVVTRGSLPQLDLPLGPAHIVAAGREGASMRIVYRAGGPDPVELHYVAIDPKQPKPRTIARGAAVPPPEKWRAGFLYVDVVPLPPGTQLAVERASVPSPGKPATVLSHTDLPR
jgi:hypothetical protein